MPPPKPRPSEIAAEAKRTYMPWIEQKLPHIPPRSYLHNDPSSLRLYPGTGVQRRLRVAVIDGDPVDVALDWYEANKTRSAPSAFKDSSQSEVPRIPLVNMANEKRAGGDWESGLMAPEECLCRRSNLAQALVRPWSEYQRESHYPLPQAGGLYSPDVVVYRGGPDAYQVWREFRTLPVISVAPVRRPKLDDSGKRYSFAEERELMREKMRTVLRIAAQWGYKDLCLGAFGVGFRNPVVEVAAMWKDLLFREPEFARVFANVCFAIDTSASSGNTGGEADYEIFRKEFDPASIFRTIDSINDATRNYSWAGASPNGSIE